MNRADDGRRRQRTNERTNERTVSECTTVGRQAGRQAARQRPFVAFAHCTLPFADFSALLTRLKVTVSSGRVGFSEEVEGKSAVR